MAIYSFLASAYLAFTKRPITGQLAFVPYNDHKHKIFLCVSSIKRNDCYQWISTILSSDELIEITHYE